MIYCYAVYGACRTLCSDGVFWRLQAGRICLVTELMDTSLMSALGLPDEDNKPYQYYAECVCIPLELDALRTHEFAA